MVGTCQARQKGRGVQLARHNRCWRHQSVVILVPEDEFTGRHTITAETGNSRLRDPVVETERLRGRLWSVAALHTPGQLTDAIRGFEHVAVQAADLRECRLVRR